MSVFLAAVPIGPLLLSNHLVLQFVPFTLLIPAIYCCHILDAPNKKADIKTYSEILAYIQGKNVDVIRKQRHQTAYVFEKIGIVAIFVVLFVVICLLSIWITRPFM